MLLKFKGMISFFIATFILILSYSSYAATVTYTYDSLNRFTKVDYGNGFTEEYTYDNAGNRLSLLVKAPLPEISVLPISYNFGNLNVGSSSMPQTFTISNTGAADLVISTICITGNNSSKFINPKNVISTIKPYKYIRC